MQREVRRDSTGINMTVKPGTSALRRATSNVVSGPKSIMLSDSS